MSAERIDEDYRIIALREIEARLRLADKLRAVEQAARRFIREGLRLTPDGLIVREWRDKAADPYCNLCDALDAVEPLNPK